MRNRDRQNQRFVAGHQHEYQRQIIGAHEARSNEVERVVMSGESYVAYGPGFKYPVRGDFRK